MEDVQCLMIVFVQLAINPISTAASARGTEGVSVTSSSIKVCKNLFLNPETLCS